MASSLLFCVYTVPTNTSIYSYYHNYYVLYIFYMILQTVYILLLLSGETKQQLFAVEQSQRLQKSLVSVNLKGPGNICDIDLTSKENEEPGSLHTL